MCSVPSKSDSQHEMVFYLQPRGGLTRRLARMAQKQADVDVRILLEGPYGGMPARWFKGFDHTLLIAGGSGSAFTLSLIEDWLSQRDSNWTGQLKVLLATRDVEMRIWYTEELQRIAERRCGTGLGEVADLGIHFYETHNISVVAPASNSLSSGDDEEKRKQGPQIRSSTHSATSLFSIKFFRGRPDTGSAVREMSLQASDCTVGVAVCGPSGMVYDVAHAAVAQQQRIISGHAGASEVWFHRESFS